MNKTKKIKIISNIVLFSIMLNFSLCYITLNAKLNLSIAFSSVAGAVTYSYNPIQFTKDLKDNISCCLYKKSDKQDAKKNESSNPVADKKNDFIISVFSHPQIKNLRQLNNFYIDKPAVSAKCMSMYNLYGKFLADSSVPFAFSFTLLMWLAIIFRKERGLLKNIKFTIKTYNSAV
ncbi:MAG: hypothetical protein FWD54_02495 [Endomicrobia bacterium]|nr:hypothetical protein [Endomicrobiia bacterium]MCL2799135.1 hypothetical protein [Endomicrobiia bacterium]